jgi:hypothetical protein
MFGLDSIGTAVKAAAALACALAVAAAIWYLAHLRGQVADLTQANANLQASVAVANTAAAVSAKSAETIADAGTAALNAVATANKAITAADIVDQKPVEDFNVALPKDQICALGEGLPAAYMRGLDGLFGQPAAPGGGAGGSDDPHQAAAAMPGGLPGVAQPAQTP